MDFLKSGRSVGRHAATTPTEISVYDQIPDMVAVPGQIRVLESKRLFLIPSGADRGYEQLASTKFVFVIATVRIMPNTHTLLMCLVYMRWL